MIIARAMSIPELVRSSVAVAPPDGGAVGEKYLGGGAAAASTVCEVDAVALQENDEGVGGKLNIYEVQDFS